MISDYRIYEFSMKEKVCCFVEGMVLNALIAILFYDSLFAMIPGSVLVFFYFKEKQRALAGKRTKGMREDLKEFLNALIAALQTGRSMENAFAEGLKDTMRYIQKDTPFITEMKCVCAGVDVGEPLEKMLSGFAYRSHLEELEYFSEVFSVGKRSGGNMIAIMKNTIRMLQERMDAEAEIHTVIAEKELEFRVMTVIPLAIIGYLRIGATGFIERLYGNVTGILVMTVCLIIYGGCYLYGKRLLEIEG